MVSPLLEIHIAGPRGSIAADLFAKVLANAVRALSDIEHSLISPRSSGIKWFIQDLKIGSAEALLIGDVPQSAYESLGSETVHLFTNGLRVEAGETLPSSFGTSALKSVAEMATPFAEGGNLQLVFSLPQDRSEGSVRLTQRASSNIKRLSTPRHRAMGSVIGMLDVVNVHTSPPKFIVYNSVDNRPITCRFRAGDLEVVTAALGSRVLASGEVVRNANGQAIRVDDAYLEPMPDTAPLGQLYGIDVGFTGGMTIHEYMEHIS